MTRAALTDWVRRVAWTCAGYALLQLLVVILNDTYSGAVFLALAICNVAWFYASTARSIDRVNWTVRSYYSVVYRTLLALSCVLSLLIAFLVVESLSSGEISVAWLGALAVVSVHQVYRGMRTVTRRWRTREDVIGSLRAIRSSSQGLPIGYDFGFFVSISIAVAALGRVYGQRLPVLIASTLLALSVPFILGLVIQGYRTLSALLPMDEDSTGLPFA